MSRSRQAAASFRIWRQISPGLIGGAVILSLIGILWQQKTSQFVQAVHQLQQNEAKDSEAIIQSLQSDLVDGDHSSTNSDSANQPSTTAQISAPTNSATKVAVVKSPAVQPASSTTNIPAVPNCQQVAHILPQPIDLTSRPDGLTHIVDLPLYFRVYGRQPKEIQQQIWRCSPPTGHRQLHAISQSQIDISYGQWQIPLSKTCRLTNVKVGLRTLMTLPTWQADQFTPEHTRQAMNRFLNGIIIHEQGHGQIDRQYAEQLLTRLRNLQAPCVSLLSEVQLITNQLQAELRAAQQAYELQTNYGAKQGAWL